MPIFFGSSKKQESSTKKHLVLLYLLCHSLWLCESQQMVENFWKKWEYQTTLPTSWEICMQIKKRQLETDMQQQIGSKLGKVYIKVVYCHPANLAYMQRTSWETLGWMKHKLKSRLLGEISKPSDMQMTSPLWQKVRKNWRVSWWKRRVKKLAKAQHSEN